MGLLKDALDLDLISQEDYDDLSQNWSDTGYSARHMGATDAFQMMIEDLVDYDCLDLADKAFEDYVDSLEKWRALYGYNIDYDIEVGSWYSTITNEFIPDPYEWIRD